MEWRAALQEANRKQESTQSSAMEALGWSPSSWSWRFGCRHLLVLLVIWVAGGGHLEERRVHCPGRVPAATHPPTRASPWAG